MPGASRVAAVVLALGVSGCVENTAPGNDRAAHVEPADPPAEIASAGSAIRGVATHLLLVETMTEADLRAAPPVGARPCRFRYTRVGFPVVLYDSAAVIKLNGKLVPLERAGAGAYAAGGVEMSIEPLEEPDGAGELFQARFIIRLPGAPNELGFHGFSEC